MLATKLNRKSSSIPEKVLGNTVLCIGELCATLREQAIASLHDVVPSLLKLMKISQCSSIDLTLMSLVIAITRISEHLAQFLSPYLTQSIIQLSRIYTEVQDMSLDTKTENLLTKFKNLWQIWAKKVPSRVIIPAINDSYEQIMDKKNVKAIGPVMELAAASFGCVSPEEFLSIENSWTEFFIKTVQFRCNNFENNETNATILNAVEEKITKAFSALVAKLTEVGFRSLYFKIQSWAFSDCGNKQRLITFFKLSHAVSVELKSLFVLFTSDIIIPASELLKSSNVLGIENNEENLLILEYILKTICNICLFDSQKFINEFRFNILMEPIVDLVENHLVTRNTTLKTVLCDTIIELGVVVADDTLWKKLNLYLLEKTRRDDVELKIFVLTTSVELARRLGEDYAQLVPETIPFFAEMMESDIDEVVAATQGALKSLEKIVGEDLQKYFN